jgi:NAD(P)-dependent dehydrogenase (short-subunit alcohol dehydrogenase family)
MAARRAHGRSGHARVSARHPVAPRGERAGRHQPAGPDERDGDAEDPTRAGGHHPEGRTDPAASVSLAGRIILRAISSPGKHAIDPARNSRVDEEKSMKLAERTAIITGGGSGIGAASARAMAAQGARVLVADLNEGTANDTAEQIQKAGGHALAISADVAKASDNQAVFDRIMAVNVKGVWLGAKVAFPVMKRPPMLATFMGKRSVDEEGMTRYVATVPLGRLNQPEDLANAAVFLASDDAAMITGSCVEVDGGRCI